MLPNMEVVSGWCNKISVSMSVSVNPCLGRALARHSTDVHPRRAKDSNRMTNVEGER
jgi:hypothetical protein